MNDGAELPRAPEYSAGVFAQFSWPMWGGNSSVRTDLKWTDDYRTELAYNTGAPAAEAATIDTVVRALSVKGIADADGLAVAVPSRFAGRIMEPLVSGGYTVTDATLYRRLLDLRARYGPNNVLASDIREPEGALAAGGVCAAESERAGGRVSVSEAPGALAGPRGDHGRAAGAGLAGFRERRVSRRRDYGRSTVFVLGRRI